MKSHRRKSVETKLRLCDIPRGGRLLEKGASGDLECLGEYFDNGYKSLAASIEAASLRETRSLPSAYKPYQAISGVQHVEERDKTRRKLKAKKANLAEEL
jgi:hypothetical protein